MPGLSGFTDNPLVTRQDFVHAAKSLIAPIEHHRSAGGARVKIHPATVAAFDDVAAQIEGFSRPLLATCAILDNEALLDCWVRGLEAGVYVGGEEYWGDMTDFDQRIVETESISLTLLSAPLPILSRLSEDGRSNLITWLRQINGHTMPANNWRWFRIFVNLALTKTLGVDRAEIAQTMQDDFALLDSFYIGEGWSSDGKWGDDRRQADYYSGSFAMQFAQLLYVRFAKDDSERVETYKKHAVLFAAEYWRYFDTDGAAIPFGRSMTYRFAFAAFWATVAVAEIDLPAPVDNLGTVKGLLLRHIRWWTKHEDIFNSDGIMNIGFTYPNMYLSEDYNSPQSVYWCLKPFISLILPEEHAFWKCEELPHPLAAEARRGLKLCQVLRPPRQIIDSSPEHHYLLSAGQMTTKPHRAKDSKYCKFSYSSAFGFSVPSGSTLGQIAPDSTLCISIDGGETWKVRGNPGDAGFETVTVGPGGRATEALTSSWNPWQALGLQIETTLVPLAQYAQGWHVRIHRVRWSQDTEAALLADKIHIVDGGFAIPSLTKTGYHVPSVSVGDRPHKEGYCCDAENALVRSAAGAGGVARLQVDLEASSEMEAEALVLRADPNTNLISPRTFIPCLKYSLSRGRPGSAEREAWLVSGVFAVAGSRVSAEDAWKMWNRKPTVCRLGEGTSCNDGHVSARFKIIIPAV